MRSYSKTSKICLALLCLLCVSTVGTPQSGGAMFGMIPPIELVVNPYTGFVEPEVWKDVVGYEDYYQISNYGRVKSVARIVPHPRWGSQTINEKILKVGSSPNGYKIARFTKNSIARHFAVHRMVAIAFIPNPNNLPQVNHKKGIKTCNYAWELEWCTALSNTLHAHGTGLVKRKYPLLTQCEVMAVKEDFKTMTHAELCKKYNQSLWTISKITSGKPHAVLI